MLRWLDMIDSFGYGVSTGKVHGRRFLCFRFHGTESHLMNSNACRCGETLKAGKRSLSVAKCAC